MAEGKIFVGRKAELEQFKEILKDPKGQAVLVVGQVGMGKTWLVDKMAEIAENQKKLKCGWVRYEVTPTDSVDSTMALMMDNAFEAAQVTEGSFNGTTRRLEQWRSLLNVINIGDLVMSLKRDPPKNTRDQFLERLRLISKHMPKEGRAIFVIDPEKYMQDKSDQSWAIVVRDLPEKVKFIFAQRPEDELVKGRAFKGLKNICYIPDGRLGALKESDVGELVLLRANDVGKSGNVLTKAVKRYKGHPYAIVGALDIVKKTRSVENLPQDPTPEAIAEAQWERICETGDQGIKLFEAYTVLEVGVPDDVLQKVSGLSATKRKRLQNDSYLRGLLRQEGAGKRIYHAILADYILGQIGEAEKNQYHSRAVEVYRGKLAKAKKEQIRPDALAAMRLAEHVLSAEGKGAFVDAFVGECYGPLTTLGLLDAAISLSQRALEMIVKDSKEEAAVMGNLGLIYRTQGELDKAEEMYKKSLKIAEKLGLQEIMASEYGNLGLIYSTRGELDKAEEMHKKALEIERKLGRLEGMAAEYCNLGVIFQSRGELDKAEKMFHDGFKIDEKLGRLEGMAADYGNLGLIYETRGELDKSEEMHRKSLEIEKKLGRLEGIASEYGNLGIVYQKQGELDKAEEMYKKSLEISEPRGMMGLTANQYNNLGSVYEKRGDIGKAKEYWEKALGLFKQIGMPHRVEEVKGAIKGLKDK